CAPLPERPTYFSLRGQRKVSKRKAGRSGACSFEGGLRCSKWAGTLGNSPVEVAFTFAHLPRLGLVTPRYYATESLTLPPVGFRFLLRARPLFRSSARLDGGKAKASRRHTSWMP